MSSLKNQLDIGMQDFFKKVIFHLNNIVHCVYQTTLANLN